MHAPVRFIPRLPTSEPPLSLYLRFLDALGAAGFKGDVSDRSADRIVFSTDNSIFQVTPQAIVSPKNHDDVVTLMTLVGNDTWSDIKLAPRGGGTGTNGQSLTAGLVVDLSRHMNRIISVDTDRRCARVEAGVVKDQLNAAVRSAGLFFAPELSTSNRATIGGMVNTDASGQGSIVYGKTHDHVLALRTVLLGGDVLESTAIDSASLATEIAREDRVGSLYRFLDQITTSNRKLIAASFPRLTRNLTGYDLVNVRRADGRFDINAVLCGSEGTLGMVTEAALNLLPQPRCVAIVAIQYGSFDAALRHGQALLSISPTSIETIDSVVLEFARGDKTWASVRAYLPESGKLTQAVNLVEFASDSDRELSASLERAAGLLNECSGAESAVLNHTVATGDRAVGSLWEMRKRAVGMLGKMPGPRRPIPFVEDTAVPPENLADYISDFRAILDARGLRYGMFGHIDAGVLHVRPTLDLTDDHQHALMRSVSDEVASLVSRHGGVLWGEHGKGFRSKYAPEVFGPVYPILQQIKLAFDPHNQLNPGKIASPEVAPLVKLEDVSTRGQFERQISEPVRARFNSVMACNGNGACFNYDHDDPMCPSWKATRDRRHSPKGRAALMREWLRRMSVAGHDDPLLSAKRQSRVGMFARMLNTSGATEKDQDFSHEVLDVMRGCLACKACATQCPVSIDVPAFRAQFLSVYYQRYQRPLRDYVVGFLESFAPWMARAPRIANKLARTDSAARLLRAVGLVDIPELSLGSFQRSLSNEGFMLVDADRFGRMPAMERDRSVVFVQDVFTSYYDRNVLLDALRLVRELGFTPLVAPYRPNGKALHAHGLLRSFEKTARRNVTMLKRIADTGVPLVGLEPATTLVYRDEYVREVDADTPKVHLLQEWLVTQLRHVTDTVASRHRTSRFGLLAHCTERSIAPESVQAWVEVFARFGNQLKLVKVGCCGMAGTFGHEVEHQSQSESVYSQSWQRVVEREDNLTILADGFSCRSQANRFSKKALLHPVSALRDLMKAAENATGC